MHRLERIEALEREGEAWLETENEGTEVAADALERCRLAYDAGVAPMV